MRYLIVLNEAAGKAGKTPPGGAPDELRRAFAQSGVTAEVRVAESGHCEDAVRSARDSRPHAVIIGGGDGTVRSAAGVLAGTGIPLGVLPMGTLNHFAKDLKIPTNLADAVATLARGATRDIDLGEVNGQVFINNCSIGAYAQAVRRRDALRDHHDLGKWWAMACASFEEFRQLRRLRLRIGVERTDPSTLSANDANCTNKRVGSTRSTLQAARVVRTPVVVVGNNRYSGRLLSQHLRAGLDEGQLWLYTVRAHRHFAVLRLMLQACVRRLDEVDALDAEPASEIVIESDGGPLSVAADGEILEISAPLHFRIRPGALRALVPPEGREAGDGRLEGERERRTEDGEQRTGGRERELAINLQPPAAEPFSRSP